MEEGALIPRLWELALEVSLGTWLILLSGYGMMLLILPRLLSEQRTSSGAWAWLLILFLEPHLGVVLYLLFGGRHLRAVTQACPNLEVPALPEPELEQTGHKAAAHNLARQGGAGVLAATEVRVISDGVEAFEAVSAMIQGAKRRVDVSIFILYQDEVGQAFVDLLAQKAREGVKVRLLLDAFGNLLGLSGASGLLRLRSFTDPIREAGGEVATFLPMLPRKTAWSVNLRNHRKMVIADDEQVMLGGMNLGRSYMGPTPDPRRWQDLITLLKGPVIAAVQTIFEEDWHIATGRHLPLPEYPGGRAGVPVQILADGPAFYEDAFARLIHVALKLARRRAVFVTPYFVPDQALQAALVAAVHAGVQVELLLPEVSNHPSADWARRPFLRELIREGAVVLAYQPGMVHSKCAIIDEDLAWISSANMDMRSMTLNFEIAAVFYSPACARQLLDYYRRLSEHCRPLKLEDLESRGPRRLGEGLLRLISPLL